MHAYSSEESRVTTYGVIAVVSVIVAWITTTLLSGLDWPEWLVGAPSVVSVYVLLYAVTDRWFWKSRPFRVLRLTSTPDLAGTYEGELQSTHEDSHGSRVTKPVRLEVTQTWTRISVRMRVGNEPNSSRSQSFVAFVGRAAKHSCLTYAYKSEVNPTVADADMGDHTGTADLEIESDGYLDGRYYNSRPRRGSITATRTESG